MRMTTWAVDISTLIHEQRNSLFLHDLINPLVIRLHPQRRLKDDDTGFVNTLAGMAGVHSAVLVSYNGDYMG